MEFAAVDCTTQQALCSANEVKGYPTIKYFSYYSKVVKHYTGGRTVRTDFVVFLIYVDSFQVKCKFFYFFKETEFIQFMADPENTATVPAQPKDEWHAESGSVLHLTDDTFKKTIESKDPVLVMFYAPCTFHSRENTVNTKVFF